MLKETTWTEKDEKTVRLPKTCSKCQKPIEPEDNFWAYNGREFYHEHCARLDMASLHWRDLHG